MATLLGVHASVLERARTRLQTIIQAGSASIASFITAAPHRPSGTTPRRAPV
jgi:hypothetical protein